MSITRVAVALAAFVMAACGGAGGTGRGGGEPRPGDEVTVRLQPPPVFGLVGDRERLALTSEQVTRLDSIAIWLGNANRELHRELRELIRPRPGGMTRKPWTREEVVHTGGVLQRIGENNLRAIEAVQEVLSDAQERIVCEMERERSTVRAARPRLEDAYGAPDRISPDTLLAGTVRSAAGWTWCHAPAPQSAEAGEAAGG